VSYKIIISIVFTSVFTSTVVSSQSYWYKMLNDEVFREFVNEIYIINDTLYVLGDRGSENNEFPFGTYIEKYDKGGIKNAKYDFPGLDSQIDAVLYDSDNNNFVFTGVNTDSLDLAHISKVNLDGELLVSNDSFSFVANDVTLAIPWAIVKYDNQFVVTGRLSNAAQDNQDGFLTYINEDLTVDTTIELRDTVWGAGQLMINEAGELICGIAVRRKNIGIGFSSMHYVTAIDRDKEIDTDSMQLLYRSEPIGAYITRMLYHPGLEKSFHYYYDDGLDGLSYVKALKPDLSDEEIVGPGDWRFALEEFQCTAMIPLHNDELLLVGNAEFEYPDDQITVAVPIAVRLNAEGRILWQRMYWGLEEDEENKVLSTFTCVVEDTLTGDLFFGGEQIKIQGPLRGLRKGFIMKTDADGCLESDCDQYNIITSQERIPDPLGDIQLSPNPSSSSIRVSHDFMEYMIYDLSGRVLLKGSHYHNLTAIDVEGFSSGIYLFLGRNEKGQIWTQQFVRE